MKTHVILQLLYFGACSAFNPRFCCTEHNTLKLSNGSSTDSVQGLSKEQCEQRCLDNPKCLASLHHAPNDECTEFTQTPVQTIGSEDYTAFLCRTRALQICTRHNAHRLCDNSDPEQKEELKTLPSDTPETCHSECMKKPNVVASSWRDPSVHEGGTSCYCFFNVPPGIGPETGYDSFLCINRLVSCKARLARKTPGADKECERYDRLQLTAVWRGHSNREQYRETPDMDEEACLRKCKEAPDCLGLTYYTPGRICFELVETVAGQEPQQLWTANHVSYLCCRGDGGLDNLIIRANGV